MKTARFLVNNEPVDLAMDCLAPWAVAMIQVLSNVDPKVGMTAKELLVELMNKVGLLDVGDEEAAISVLLGRLKKAGLVQNVPGNTRRYIRAAVAIQLAI